MLAVVHAEALVFGAHEDGGEDVAGDEEEEETVVQFWVVQGVETGEEDQTEGAGDGEENWTSYQTMRFSVLGQQASDLLANALSVFSVMCRFFASRPVCRSHRSEAMDRSRNTVVMTAPVMKRGFKLVAPMSEM